MADIKDVCTGIFILAMLCFFVPVRIEYPGRTKATFDTYVKRFNKTYTNNKSEYESRYRNFKNSLLRIEQLNAMNDGMAKFGLTSFSDMSEEEFVEEHLDLRPQTKKGRRKHKKHYHIHETESYHETHGDRYERSATLPSDIPLALDWRDRGVVTAVRDQGMCGACWAHSTVAAIESRLAIATGNLTELSVEEMVDCARLGNFGCLGGDICSLLVWLSVMKVPVLKELEYTSNANKACSLNASEQPKTSLTIKNYTCEDLSKQEKTIVKLLADRGPVAVAVNALPWQHYLGGIIQFHCSASLDDLNHAVELVGYNMSDPIPYYIARNSWGTTFGDNGYLKLAIGSNVCGLANEVADIDVNIS